MRLLLLSPTTLHCLETKLQEAAGTRARPADSRGRVPARERIVLTFSREGVHFRLVSLVAGGRVGGHQLLSKPPQINMPSQFEQLACYVSLASGRF